MLVIKIGGSLFDDPKLSEWLKILSEEGAGKVVIVPGGGPFADQVRNAQNRWKFNDQQAHQMALHAMDQFGLMLVGVAKEQGYDLFPVNSKQEIHKILASKKTPVWLPSKWLEKKSEIPQNWSITSDSLSAWLSKQLEADHLILIKSISPIETDITFEELEKKNVIDPCLKGYARGEAFKTSYISFSLFSEFKKMLEKENHTGPYIS